MRMKAMRLLRKMSLWIDVLRDLVILAAIFMGFLYTFWKPDEIRALLYFILALTAAR